MKILCLGDTHFRYKRPQRRTDDFFETQYQKMKWVLEKYNELECSALLQVGDLFDSSDISNYVIATYVNYFRNYVNNPQLISVYTVFGQHDLVGHSLSSSKRTPMWILKEGYLINIVSEKWEWITNGININKDWDVYGCSFGQEVPALGDGEHFEKIEGRILIIHANIGDRPLWPGHEPEDPKNFLRKHPEFDLVVAGDYHYSFEARIGDRVILNPGALVRLKANKWDLAHHPKIAIFDTETRKVEWHEVPHKKAEDVFDLSNLEEEKYEEERKTKLKLLVAAMERDKETSVSFADNLMGYYRKEKVDEQVKGIISEMMGG